ncbi:hypothetical protein GWI33_005177 [Rhynchophorus ferrugineus]|uniref:Uncharacterized protein n=1 Tax=Rhynchophorus ferrugineus TaxID=354439 RepID=A0A834IJR7_RHYFE|nr:hypothetical protein GWI33_005177 [Rhynchophorus ferrugineus]
MELWFCQVQWTLKHAEAEEPFNKLKEALRECLGLSIQNRTQLFEWEEWYFLRRLHSLAGDTTGQHIIKLTWMNQLDPITRAGIAAQQGNTKLEDLAKIANNIRLHSTAAASKRYGTHK